MYSINPLPNTTKPRLTTITNLLAAAFIITNLTPTHQTVHAADNARITHPTAAELLSKYSESQDKLKSFVMEYEDEYVAEKRFNDRYGPNVITVRGGRLGEIRSDGNRHLFTRKIWKEGNPRFAPNKKIAKSNPNYLSLMWDNENRYQYMASKENASRDKLFLQVKNHERTARNGRNIIDNVRDRALRGVFEDTYTRAPYVRIDVELEKANTMSVRAEMEEINGSKCYVLTAQSKDSKYNIWIDPEHGYNIAQAEIYRGGEGVEFGNDKEISLNTYLKNVCFEKIDDMWVPMEADYGFDRREAKGDFIKEDHNCKRTKFILNPDHEALGSFKTDYIRNGTQVQIIGADRVIYTWQNGKLVDKQGNTVLKVAMDPNTPSTKTRGTKRHLTK